jgi:hypothetical protein
MEEGMANQQIGWGIRKRSATMVLGLPLFDIAIGGAVGFIAVGGFAVGYYAAGGAAYGKYMISAMHRSPEAVDLFGKLFSFLPFK